MANWCAGQAIRCTFHSLMFQRRLHREKQHDSCARRHQPSNLGKTDEGQQLLIQNACGAKSWEIVFLFFLCVSSRRVYVDYKKSWMNVVTLAWGRLCFFQYAHEAALKLRKALDDGLCRIILVEMSHFLSRYQCREPGTEYTTQALDFQTPSNTRLETLEHVRTKILWRRCKLPLRCHWRSSSSKEGLKYTCGFVLFRIASVTGFMPFYFGGREKCWQTPAKGSGVQAKSELST